MDTVEYWTFVLGYDLLHDNLKDLKVKMESECK